jgi:hypothetical protein
MKLLVSGCSFTHHRWPQFLSNHSITDLAWPGAGNKYISDSIIHHCSIKKFDAVLVMWSGLTRLDMPVPNSLKLFNNYDFIQPVGNFNYIMSGGVLGSWQHHPGPNQLFKNTYKIMSTEELAWLSLLEIIKLQGFLKNLGIKYYFMSYVNYWNRPVGWISKNCDPTLKDFLNLNNIINQIDFSSWIFLNDNKDGIYEFAEKSNLFESDNWHPNSTADQTWASIVEERLNCFQH